MSTLPAEVEMAQANSPERYLFGEIEVKSASESKMQMAGFVSTPRVDLATEVVEVDSFKKYFDYYKRNPIYCYNHDKTLPIGRVDNPVIVESGVKTGLYLDNITLSPIPIVKEVIWPLVLDKVLTQQSIGFLSLKGQMDGRVYHHKEVYMLESSLVPIACNPEATIDTIKSVLGTLPDGYQQFETLGDLIGAFEKGILRLPSEIRRVFSMPELPPTVGEPPMKLDSSKSEATTPDFADAVVLQAQVTKHDPEGAERPKPHRNEKDYVETCDLIHAAKSDTRGSYLFQIAVPTEKGFKYDWTHLAMSMSRVLGGNGGAHFSREQKSAIIDRIVEGYTVLGKEAPVVTFNDGSVPVNKLLPEVLETTSYNDVEFRSGEKDVVKLAFLKKDVESVANALASYKKDGDLPEGVKEVVKTLYGYVDVSVYTSVTDPDALTFMTTLINIINQYVAGEEGDSGDSVYMMSAPEGLRKFAQHLLDKADKMEAEAKKEKGLEAVADEVEMPLDDMRQLMDELGKISDLV